MVSERLKNLVSLLVAVVADVAGVTGWWCLFNSTELTTRLDVVVITWLMTLFTAMNLVLSWVVYTECIKGE